MDGATCQTDSLSAHRQAVSLTDFLTIQMIISIIVSRLHDSTLSTAMSMNYVKFFE